MKSSSPSIKNKPYNKRALALMDKMHKHIRSKGIRPIIANVISAMDTNANHVNDNGYSDN